MKTNQHSRPSVTIRNRAVEYSDADYAPKTGRRYLLWAAVVAIPIVAAILSPEFAGALPGLLLGIACIAVYMVPSLAAHSRKHRAKDAVTALNLLLGWTLLGWVIAFVWAFTENNAEATR